MKCDVCDYLDVVDLLLGDPFYEVAGELTFVLHEYLIERQIFNKNGRPGGVSMDLL